MPKVIKTGLNHIYSILYNTFSPPTPLSLFQQLFPWKQMLLSLFLVAVVYFPPLSFIFVI